MKIQTGALIAALLFLGTGCDGQEKLVSPQPNSTDDVSLAGGGDATALLSVMSVDPASVHTTVFDDFGDLQDGFLEGILVRTDVQYAETFAGVQVIPVLTWDRYTPGPPGNATFPVTSQAGATHENLFGVAFGRGMQMLAGCGPLSFPSNAGASCENIDGTGRGTGAVSMLFDYDTDAVVLELVAPLGVGDGGVGDLHANWVAFYDRSGTLLDWVLLGTSPGCTGPCAVGAFRSATQDGLIPGTQFGKSRWAFQAAPGQLIAGVLFENETGAFGAAGGQGEFGTKIARIEWNRLPVAMCQNVTVTPDPGHAVTWVTADQVNDGSSDPGGGPVTLKLEALPSASWPLVPASLGHKTGIFPVGTTTTILSVTNDLGNEDTCTADVTVNPPPPPTPVDPHLLCNVPVHRTITPPDAPITFTATGTDGSGAIPVTVTDFECYGYNGSGKRVDKGESCIVSTDGASVTIHDAGGVADFISWTIEPSSGGTAVSCQVGVINPNH